jgi:putative peptide zinc metalloprotease protein
MEAALPALRDDLSLHPGPAAPDGSPSWTIRDPIRNRYFRIGWQSFAVLSRWGASAPSVAQAVNAETTLELDAEDVREIAQFLMANQLTRPQGPADTRRLAAMAAAEKTSWFQWLLHHYLFFRIPLVRPDRILAAAAPWVAWLGGRAFRQATFGALVLGLGLIIRQWDLFTASLVDTLSPSGLLSYGLALCLVKIIHELAHALTAKRFGCRVPTMGVAFLVMWPVLYTDVNEAWTLPSRRQRLWVDAAGILAELSVAAWATLAWVFLPDGVARQGAFVLATLTWVSALAINLSPFMRFDGYFLLMDALEIPNLHPRAFAMARWQLRELLFGLGEPAPEEMTPRRRLALAAFAVAVWIYRLVLFLGIAALVYHFFIKAVGVLLFAVEIGWFVALPIWGEIRQWAQRRDVITAGRRWRIPAGLIGLGLALALIPWRTHVDAPAVLSAELVTPLFLPAAARLDAVLVTNGQTVTKGDRLILGASPDIAFRQKAAGARRAAKTLELEAVRLDPFGRERLSALTEELSRLEAENAALEAEASRLVLTAPHDGVALDLLPDMRPGDWLSPRQPLGLVRANDHPQAIAYVTEEDLERIAVGDRASFTPQSPDHGGYRGTVTSIDRNPVRLLSEPSLAAIHGGAIPARPQGQALIPQTTIYRVVVRLDGDAPAIKLAGHASISGRGQSPLGRVARAALVILVREWGT